jgi:hypothetical protein
MGALSLALIYWFARRGPVSTGQFGAKESAGSALSRPGDDIKPEWGLYGRLFLLGGGFMLVETKAVVHLALLFGSTWIVNSIVFSGVLMMILLANLFVLVFRPRRLTWLYVGLLGAMAANLLPLDLFLGMSRPIQITLSCLLVSAPIFFAGVIFATTFGQSREANYALGVNVAGSILGGFAESSSMLLGFNYLMLVGIGFYGLSWLAGALMGREAESPALPESKYGEGKAA